MQEFSTLYNIATTTLTSTKVSYKWRIKDGVYRLFASNLSTVSTTTESHYRPKKNMTIIMKTPIDMDDNDTDDDADSRPVKTTLQGMVIVGLTTQKGKINVSY